MKNILVVESSPRGGKSQSHQLTQAVVDRLKLKNPSATVKTHDLTSNPVPHFGEAILTALATAPEKHTEADKQVLRHSDEAIAEVMNADVIVLGVPMYNFSVPSAFKAWIDHIARAGRTFRYSASGAEGLVKGKKVYLAIASGGVYSEGPMKVMDFTEPYLRAVLGFLGMTDVETYRVEGLGIPGLQDTALEKAIGSITA